MAAPADFGVISVIGGTGALGGGLAYRWARAQLPLVIGSRNPEKAAGAARDLSAATGNARIRGMGNRDAARAGNVVVLAVPFDHQRPTLGDIAGELAGKILVDTTVPLVPPRVARVQLPAEGCAALIAQSLVANDVSVVSAFHNVAADSLSSGDSLDCDVLVFGNKADARETVVRLATLAGMRAWHGGSIENSAAAEALTSVLIFMNKRYGGVHTGIRITGIAGQ